MSVISYYRYCLFLPIAYGLTMFLEVYFGIFLHLISLPFFLTMMHLVGLIPYIPLAIWAFIKTKNYTEKEIRIFFNKLPIYLFVIGVPVLGVAVGVYFLVDQGTNFFEASLMSVLASLFSLILAVLLGAGVIGGSYVLLIKLSAFIFLNLGLLKSDKEEN